MGDDALRPLGSRRPPLLAPRLLAPPLPEPPLLAPPLLAPLLLATPLLTTRLGTLGPLPAHSGAPVSGCVAPACPAGALLPPVSESSLAAQPAAALLPSRSRAAMLQRNSALFFSASCRFSFPAWLFFSRPAHPFSRPWLAASSTSVASRRARGTWSFPRSRFYHLCPREAILFFVFVAATRRFSFFLTLY